MALSVLRVEPSHTDDRHHCGRAGTAPWISQRKGDAVALKLHTPPEPSREPSSLTDEELLLGYRDHARVEFFDELVRRHGEALRRFLARYLGDRALADDVLQETWIRVHAKCNMFRDGRSARAWLFTFARHLAIDTLRRSARRRDVSLDRNESCDQANSLADLVSIEDCSPLDRLVDLESQAHVRESMTRLPESMRRVLELSYCQDMKYVDIAEQLGIPLGTVKSRVNAAVTRLGAMVHAPERARVKRKQTETPGGSSSAPRASRRTTCKGSPARLRGWSATKASS